MKNLECLTCITQHEELEKHLLKCRFSLAEEYLDSLVVKGNCFINWEAYRLIGRAVAEHHTNEENALKLEAIQLKFYQDCNLSELSEEQLAYGTQKTQHVLTNRIKARREAKIQKEKNAEAGRKARRSVSHSEFEERLLETFGDKVL